MNTEVKNEANKNKPATHSIKHSTKHLDRLWLVMIAITLTNALIAEQAKPSAAIAVLICGMIVIKARLVIDYFMELKEASPYIYYLMNAYFYIFPLVALLVWLYPEPLAELTRLSRF
ncbi:cytochrome C oxidase subunit IV family protein [Litoribrevibacter euphylliae]|uniref:Cytochrome C oxidase subunit IV family protein n=1 Tax=Litoribrevibacter euphylliae TaxID=1834034 RepID=A0ABV7HHF5_9GAMM